MNGYMMYVTDEDRDALAWVRAYGGLEKVKQDALCWNTAENIAQATLDWLARVCPVAGIEKCGYGISLEKLEDAINRRLMPEGMEWLLEVWPRWSNGECCRFGDWWTADRYGEDEPRQLRRLVIYTPELLDEWEQGDGESYGYDWDFMRPRELDYRPDKVDPPAPSVPGADGEPLEVGQTAWDVDAEADTPLTVVEVSSDLVRCEYTWKDGKTYRPCYPPDQLTHTKPDPPDSWERVEEDAEKNPCDYFGFDGEEICGKCPASGKNCEQTMALDLVRRCRALAERERGE